MAEAAAGNLEGDRLAALLDTLLPGNGAWPGASELDLASTVVERVGMAEGHDEALERLLDALPSGFVSASVDDREASLKRLEGTDDFGVAILVAYDAYYVHRRVVDLLEKRCDYVTRPPQPEGFELESFDESRLARARERAPFWRKT